MGGVLRDRFEQLRQAHEKAAKGAARAALADPGSTTLDELKKPERAALVRFWEAWQDELATVRLLDPACGSGAFLIEAFDQLHAAYQASNDRLEELRGHRTLFDLDKRILENNLYGVDLNEEAIEICRLSLWIKTAERGKVLTSLDHTIRVGNSIVADPAVRSARRSTGRPRSRRFSPLAPRDLRTCGGPGEPLSGGFDVVVANPPYVRQELLTPDQALPGIGLPRLSRHGRSLRLLLRTGHPAAEAGRAAVLRRDEQVDEGRLRASRCGGSFRTRRGSSRWWTSGTPSRYSRRWTYSRRSSLPAARPMRRSPTPRGFAPFRASNSASTI